MYFGLMEAHSEQTSRVEIMEKNKKKKNIKIKNVKASDAVMTLEQSIWGVYMTNFEEAQDSNTQIKEKQ